MKASDVSVDSCVGMDPNVLILVKCDTSLLFKKLNELKSNHRILMTGVRS